MSYVTNSSLARGLRPHRCSDSKAFEFSTPKRSVGALFLYHTYSPISFWFSHSVFVVPFHLSETPPPCVSQNSWCSLKGKVCPCSRPFAGFYFCCSQVSIRCWGQISKTCQLSKHFPLRKIPDIDLQPYSKIR